MEKNPAVGFRYSKPLSFNLLIFTAGQPNPETALFLTLQSIPPHDTVVIGSLLGFLHVVIICCTDFSNSSKEFKNRFYFFVPPEESQN